MNRTTLIAIGVAAVAAIGCFLSRMDRSSFVSPSLGAEAAASIHVLDRPVPIWHSAQDGITRVDLCRVSSCSYSNDHLTMVLAPPEGILGGTLFTDIDIDMTNCTATGSFHGSHREKMVQGVSCRETLQLATRRLYVWGARDGMNRISIIFDIHPEGEDLIVPNFSTRYLINIEVPVRLVGRVLPDVQPKNATLDSRISNTQQK